MDADRPGEDDAGVRAARRRLAAALRALRDELPGTAAGAEEILAAAEAIAAVARSFARQPSPRPPGSLRSPVGVDVPGMADFKERGPIVGLASVVAPPAELRADLEQKLVLGSVRFGRAFEGAPGVVHGGFLAAVLDEALGMATMFSGELSLTGEIAFRYRRPTPIETPLRIVARFDRREGRRLYTSGEIHDGEAATVEASGTFVAVGAHAFGRLEAGRPRAKRAGRVEEPG